MYKSYIILMLIAIISGCNSGSDSDSDSDSDNSSGISVCNDTTHTSHEYSKSGCIKTLTLKNGTIITGPPSVSFMDTQGLSSLYSQADIVSITPPYGSDDDADIKYVKGSFVKLIKAHHEDLCAHLSNSAFLGKRNWEILDGSNHYLFQDKITKDVKDTPAYSSHNINVLYGWPLFSGREFSGNININKYILSELKNFTPEQGYSACANFYTRIGFTRGCAINESKPGFNVCMSK